MTGETLNKKKSKETLKRYSVYQVGRVLSVVGSLSMVMTQKSINTWQPATDMQIFHFTCHVDIIE